MQFTILLDPTTKKNSQKIIRICPKDKSKKAYYKIKPSKKYEDFEKACSQYIADYKGLNIDYPVNVKCLYYRKTKHTVDLPNLINATLDMLVHYGVLADDNRNIVYSTDGSRVLYDKENPRTEVTIEPIHEEMQWWGKKERK